MGRSPDLTSGEAEGRGQGVPHHGKGCPSVQAGPSGLTGEADRQVSQHCGTGCSGGLPDPLWWPDRGGTGSASAEAG